MRSKAVDLEPEVETYARITLATPQAPPAGVNTKVNLDGVWEDPGNNFDVKTHEYIVPVTGIYFIEGRVLYGGLGANWNCSIVAMICRNDAVETTGMHATMTSQEGYVSATVSLIRRFNRGERIALYTYNASAWSLYGGGDNCHLDIQKMANASDGLVSFDAVTKDEIKPESSNGKEADGDTDMG